MSGGRLIGNKSIAVIAVVVFVAPAVLIFLGYYALATRIPFEVISALAGVALVLLVAKIHRRFGGLIAVLVAAVGGAAALLLLYAAGSLMLGQPTYAGLRSGISGALIYKFFRWFESWSESVYRKRSSKTQRFSKEGARRRA